MDLTFISIHDLTRDARILYTSDSIVDVLGYTPDEVVNRSCWDFFPAEEVPFAKEYHKRGLDMDRAAVLAYCRVKNKEGDWTGCECCFTVVYDVMVVCTSIYRQGLPSQKRAMEAPVIRRIFSNSPKDPRYHMLSHISTKFQMPTKPFEHEPRAALFLNRFTRTLTIMYATSGIEDVIGIPAEVMRGRSFYYCIEENCLTDAVKCLENAKGNDSIAYLRFWFRDPRIDDTHSATDTTDDSDEEMTTESSVDQEIEGGVHLEGHSGHDTSSGSESNALHPGAEMDVDQGHNSRTSSGDTTHPQSTHEAIFGNARDAESSASSLPITPADEQPREPLELEAVISCTSDGLVVCLRRARPLLPHPTHRPSQPVYSRGLFAAPWAAQPIVPPIESRAQHGYSTGFAPSLGPQAAQTPAVRAGGPDQNDFMSAIREQAIFAWALTGINGALHNYSKGKPYGESLPADGLPVWESDAEHHSPGSAARTDSGPGAVDGIMKPSNYPIGTAEGGGRDYGFGDPGFDKRDGYRSGSAGNRSSAS